MAYSQSKTANIFFAVEAAWRWGADGIVVNALNPGRIAATNLSRHLALPPATFDPAGTTGVSVKTVEQGAATSVLLAACGPCRRPCSQKQRSIRGRDALRGPRYRMLLRFRWWLAQM
ncbi:Rossmann-fold NAD(P)-binding domain-containing protein [Subtercola endophyticus]|uniref:hypothetical protein n=1 Tax=Subtercola endophyticus TaxID=2895559 RepID=UPI001E5357AC|nr:hypothetical protein [Subtercola endophyticus]UFS58274.1 hypothetical protein LQ955_14820 [Subtercola endophyticus]